MRKLIIVFSLLISIGFAQDIAEKSEPKLIGPYAKYVVRKSLLEYGFLPTPEMSKNKSKEALLQEKRMQIIYDPAFTKIMETL